MPVSLLAIGCGKFATVPAASAVASRLQFSHVPDASGPGTAGQVFLNQQDTAEMSVLVVLAAGLLSSDGFSPVRSERS